MSECKEFYVMKRKQLEEMTKHFLGLRKNSVVYSDDPYMKGLYDGFTDAMKLLGLRVVKVDGVDAVRPQFRQTTGSIWWWLNFYRNELRRRLCSHEEELKDDKDGIRVLSANAKKLIQDSEKYIRHGIKDVNEFLDEYGLYNV